MKYARLFILTAVMLIITVSCDNKDVTNILIAKKRSFDKVTAAYLKFKNEFMLHEALFNNGSIDTELFLTGYDMRGSSAENFLKSARPILDLIIQKKIGFKSTFINDSAAKEFKYLCSFEHFLKTEKETPIVNIIIGQKNIKAAIPAVYNKTFSLPVNGIGKLLYMIEPRDAFLQLDIDFSYTTLKQLYALKPDAASQKRYDEAYKILYKNAAIKKNGDTYFVTFNSNDVLMYISAMVKAIKNDNRMKAFWSVYEKAFAKEFKKLEETFNSDIKKNMQHITFTEELTVKDGFVAKDTIHADVDGKEFLDVVLEVEDYENPIGSLNCTSTFSDPRANSNEKIIISFKSKGSVSETAANVDYSFMLGFPNIASQPFSGIGMHCYFYADTQKPQENFKTGIDVQIQSPESRSLAGKSVNNKLKNIDFALQAVGGIQKAKDTVTYTINSIGLDVKVPTENNAFMFETDATVVLNKKIPKSIEMPKETVYVLETKNDEWERIQEEIGANLMDMGRQTNF